MPVESLPVGRYPTEAIVAVSLDDPVLCAVLIGANLLDILRHQS